MNKDNAVDSGNSSPRHLKWWEIQQLERQGCASSDWSAVSVSPETDLSLIRDVEFVGENTIGILDSEKYPGSGIRNATLENCIIGNGVRIKNVYGSIVNAHVNEGVEIENVGRVEFEPEALCGIGLHVAVLDESGSRPVTIYPGLSAQAAMLMARDPKGSSQTVVPQSQEFCEKFHPLNIIGEKAVIKDCGSLFNVFVDREVEIKGALSLSDGSIVNNSAPGRPISRVGHGVDAKGFIIEDGIVESGAILRNVYVGQGARIASRFSAHDSLFFANCNMENGEACAFFAGPYTVSMHKSTLLIGAQTSFMNAGSGSNQSNHMYKLGPVHWGILERGVKTSSDSYLMHGAVIGAFSLLMGSHKTHPNSSEFPFSYLFGDAQGATVVVPAMMLKSCGLMRDEMKWPTRDNRLKHRLPLNDKIIFDVLNPYTVDKILQALSTIEELIHVPADDDRFIRYKGMKINRAALERAKKFYSLAIFKYLTLKLPEGFKSESAVPAESLPEWIDLAGLIMTRERLAEVMETDSVEEREALLQKTYEDYPEAELDWIEKRFDEMWRVSPEKMWFYAEEYDKLVDDDRTAYRDQLSAEIDMLKL